MCPRNVADRPADEAKPVQAPHRGNPTFEAAQDVLRSGDRLLMGTMPQQRVGQAGPVAGTVAVTQIGCEHLPIQRGAAGGVAEVDIPRCLCLGDLGFADEPEPLRRVTVPGAAVQLTPCLADCGLERGLIAQQ